MHITILALGSRGDVQPYVALGLGLRQAGHDVRLVAIDLFREFVESRGLDYFPIDTFNLIDAEGEARATVGSTLDRGGQLRQVLIGFRALLPIWQQTLLSMWEASQGTQAIVFSTVGTSAYHVAEALQVPCIWALTVPMYGRTRVFPNPALPSLPLGRVFNRLTYVLFQQFWRQLLGRHANTWRRQQANLPPIPLYRWPFTELRGKPVPALYAYSPAVSPKPADWGEDAHLTGYWFLDHPSDWRPPEDLLRFLESGPPPVYVGFGSMVSRDPEGVTRIVLDAVARSGQRAVVAAGWGALSHSELPDDVFPIEAAPHDWLFPRMAAVVHHGGAGTTGAGVRAGVPSIVVPFGGDQPFWARRIKALGVGPDPIARSRLSAEGLAQAVRAAVTDEPMRKRAAALGKLIRAENGVRDALRIISQVTGDRGVG